MKQLRAGLRPIAPLVRLALERQQRRVQGAQPRGQLVDGCTPAIVHGLRSILPRVGDRSQLRVQKIIAACFLLSACGSDSPATLDAPGGSGDAPAALDAPHDAPADAPTSDGGGPRVGTLHELPLLPPWDPARPFNHSAEASIAARDGHVVVAS